MSLTASGLNAVVAPGVSRNLDVELRQECLRWLRTEPIVPLDLRVEITTADGVHRSQLTYLSVGDTEWGGVLEGTCTT